MKKNLVVIVLLFIPWSTALGNIDDWGKKENLRYAAHYKMVNGKVKLIKKWKHSYILDNDFFTDSLIKRGTGVKELIIVGFRVDDSKRAKNAEPVHGHKNKKSSIGWKYEVKDGIVMAWEGRDKVVKRIKLESFYKRLHDLTK